MPADLDALDALLQAATPGPWTALGCDVTCLDRDGHEALIGECWNSIDGEPDGEFNAALIAAAVTALPDLLRRVRLGDAAREVLEALEKWRGAAFDAEMRPTLGEREVARADVRLRYDKVAAARARYRALLETPDAS